MLNYDEFLLVDCWGFNLVGVKNWSWLRMSSALLLACFDKSSFVFIALCMLDNYRSLTGDTLPLKDICLFMIPLTLWWSCTEYMYCVAWSSSTVYRFVPLKLYKLRLCLLSDITLDRLLAEFSRSCGLPLYLHWLPKLFLLSWFRKSLFDYCL